MRLPWNKSKEEQLDLVDEASAEPGERLAANATDVGLDPPTSADASELSLDALYCRRPPSSCAGRFPRGGSGQPEDRVPGRRDRRTGPRHRAARHPPADRGAPRRRGGRYRVLFGAKRLRAARQAGLQAVPVVIGSQAHDAYAQVAENQKRHGLTPLDLARFMRSRADAGESNAEIARRLGIDLTSVAHHLALLTLPPELDEAFRSGRCTSPRTLYELAKLQKTRPEQVKAIVGREGEITRSAVASIKKASRSPRRVQRKTAASRRRTSLADQANALCSRFESLLEPHDQGRRSSDVGRVGSRASSPGRARRHVGGRRSEPINASGRGSPDGGSEGERRGEGNGRVR